MSTPTSSADSSNKSYWPTVASFAIPPVAASGAIVPVFRDLIIKSAQQRGEAIPSITISEGLKKGLRSAPTVGVIVGTQMVIQQQVEKVLMGDSKSSSFSSSLLSSAIVGAASAPVLAVFNGQTMGKSMWESIRNFTPRQGGAIAAQETAFVAGISAADKLSTKMKQKLGDNKFVDYAAAFFAGAAGSIAGHPANTALTRGQSGMKLESFGQSLWGVARKARAVGCFSVLYKFAKENLNRAVPSDK